MVLMRFNFLGGKRESYSMVHKGGTIRPFPHQRKLGRALNQWPIDNYKYILKAQPHGKSVRFILYCTVLYLGVSVHLWNFGLLDEITLCVTLFFIFFLHLLT